MQNENFNLNEFNQTLTDVRKAYRLLFDYQTRIRGLVSYIKDIYNLQYAGGYSKFSAKQNEGSNSLEKWAWDWLNMYYYEFHFQPKTIEGKLSNFSIFHLADSGYFDAKFGEKENLKKLNVTEFNDVQSSRTKLIFVAGTDWHIGSFSYSSKNWNNEILLCGDNQGVERIENNIFIFKHFELSDFINEETALRTLNSFSEFANNNDVPFEINDIEF